MMPKEMVVSCLPELHCSNLDIVNSRLYLCLQTTCGPAVFYCVLLGLSHTGFCKKKGVAVQTHCAGIESTALFSTVVEKTRENFIFQ